MTGKVCYTFPQPREYTPLLVACEYQRLEIVSLLTEDRELRELVDISSCSSIIYDKEKKIGRSGALHLAAFHDSQNCSEKIAECLIHAGCDVGMVDANVSDVAPSYRRLCSNDK